MGGVGEREGNEGTVVCIHAMNEYRENGGTGPLILNLGISWR